MADYLTDEEQAERLKRWWDSYGTALVLGLALAVAGVVGFRYLQDYLEGRADAAATAFAAYVDARKVAAVGADGEADPADAAVDDPELAATLDGEHAGSTFHVLSLLYRARDQAQDRDWPETLAFLERAIELADEGPLKDLARHRAAEVLFQLERLEESTAMLAQITSPGLAAKVAELSGDVALAQGDAEAAREAYRAGVEAAQAGERPLPGLRLLELKLASVVVEEA